MSKGIYTYRVEDSADYEPPSSNVVPVPYNTTIFVIKDREGREIGHSTDMDWARSYCKTMNAWKKIKRLR